MVRKTVAGQKIANIFQMSLVRQMPTDLEKADEVLAGLTGINPPLDISGRRIAAGDWVARAVGGKGSACLMVGRAFPADVLTKHREQIRQRQGSATPHVTVYHIARAHGPAFGNVPNKTTCDDRQLCIIDRAHVSENILETLDHQQAELDATIKSYRAAERARWSGYSVPPVAREEAFQL